MKDNRYLTTGHTGGTGFLPQEVPVLPVPPVVDMGS